MLPPSGELVATEAAAAALLLEDEVEARLRLLGLGEGEEWGEEAEAMRKEKSSGLVRPFSVAASFAEAHWVVAGRQQACELHFRSCWRFDTVT